MAVLLSKPLSKMSLEEAQELFHHATRQMPEPVKYQKELLDHPEPVPGEDSCKARHREIANRIRAMERAEAQYA